jgi:hypothetical protein
MREWKRNETKMPEEYCWATTQAMGRSRCGRSGYSVLEFGWGKKSVYTLKLLPERMKQINPLMPNDL